MQHAPSRAIERFAGVRVLRKAKKMVVPKIAVVSGADHGLGSALAAQLVRRGYTVFAGRYDKDFDAGCLNPVNLPLDLGDQASIDAFAASVGQRTEGIDLLVNNAGILGDMKKTVADRLDRDDIRRVIEVNAIGTLMLTNALYPLIAAGRDKLIVNISSEAGSIGDCYRVGWFGYCMSKAANNMQGALVHNLLRQIGGRVIQMHPGHVRSYMRGHLDETGKLTPEASAVGILKTVLDTPAEVGERPVYMDYEGKRLNY
jgi:NAD(P)-dependent dehydrogenase (short-subunit alcohol dehydrogenase family)